MSSDFGYCEACGKRITGSDFAFGDAVRKGGRVYCSECYRQSAAETNEMPARRAPRRKPSTRSMPAGGSRRRVGRKRRRSSSRRTSDRGRPAAQDGGAQSAMLAAEIQKLAASVSCPYCYEKLVVKIERFPSTHTCEVCGKTMRISAPTV